MMSSTCGYANRYESPSFSGANFTLSVLSTRLSDFRCHLEKCQIKMYEKDICHFYRYNLTQIFH